MPEQTDEQIKAQQAAEQAIVPPPGPAFIQEIVKENAEADKKEVHPDEDVALLMELSKSDAWKVLKRYIETKQKRLADMTAQSVRAQAFDLQNTGFRYLIQDQVTNALNDIIKQVENPAKMKAIERSFASGEDPSDE